MGLWIDSYVLIKICSKDDLEGGGLHQTLAIISNSLSSEIRLKQMRNQINKVNKGHSTKSERRFMELLKKLHIPFRYKVKVKGREVDFIVGNMAIEIDGHPQDSAKNWLILEAGYNPIHLSSWEIPNPRLEEWFKKEHAIRSKS